MTDEGWLSGVTVEQVPTTAVDSVERLVLEHACAEKVPALVRNWQEFAGALATVVLGYPSPSQVLGSAVMIAPGLAITAQHVVHEMREAASDAALTTVSCIAPQADRLDIWEVCRLILSDADDWAYLALRPRSDLAAKGPIRTIGLTTRTPRAGELLTILGWRFHSQDDSTPQLLCGEGALYAATGQVHNVYTYRDAALMPYPTIEVSCGSLGGMSGGAVLDRQGLLMGIVGRGLSTADGEGPTFCPWVVGALNRTLELPWPLGLYPQPIHVLAIPPTLLHVEGRWAIEVVEADASYHFRTW